MDFCVRCGKKQLFQEHLCRNCYAHLHSVKAPKKKRVKQNLPVQKHMGYFEAVIQLRNIEQGIADFVFLEADAHHVQVSKVNWLKNGADLFVSDRKFARNTGKILQRKFGGLVRASARIFTRDRSSGKEVYRVTLLFKQFPYHRGEQFTFKGKTYTVLNIANDVYVEDSDHKKKKLRFDDLELDRVF
ncbi:hypothetical protein HY497_01930 [Candidatus Woesearchaeota archaeon]|nr:hypothetical protein [Candidatus Woesearchaeota archaeon]